MNIKWFVLKFVILLVSVTSQICDVTVTIKVSNSAPINYNIEKHNKNTKFEWIEHFFLIEYAERAMMSKEFVPIFKVKSYSLQNMYRNDMKIKCNELGLFRPTKTGKKSSLRKFIQLFGFNYERKKVTSLPPELFNCIIPRRTHSVHDENLQVESS